MAVNITPLINGKSYEWADITCNILGVPVVGITSLEYKEEQQMENIYGAGSYPVSRGYGKVEPSAKVTLLMEEVEAIQAVAPDGRLNAIAEFDIIVSFIDTNLVTRQHKLRNCRFKNNARSSNQGDTSIPVELDLVLSHIEWK